MTYRRTLITALFIAATLLLFLGCDSNSPAAPTPTATPRPTPTTDCNICRAEVPTKAPAGTSTASPVVTETAIPPVSQLSGAAVDTAQIIAPPTPNDNLPTPTPVTATASGPGMTAMQALARLAPRALEWQADARLAMLADVRPGQQENILRSALGDPNNFEATPGGIGRNWTLVAVSPSRGALAVSLDGTQVDLSAQQDVTGEAIGNFSLPRMASLELSKLDPGKLTDSDEIVKSAGTRLPAASTGVALLAPEGLGEGPMPTPAQGGDAPLLVYQLFSTDPSHQSAMYYDALTGALVLDASAP